MCHSTKTWNTSLYPLADIELEKILRDHIATEDKVYIGRGERDYKKGKIAELATITYK